MKKKYLFLDDTVYSPKERYISFGSEVTIDKRNGDEIWFSFVNYSKLKGYVVYPNLFVASTVANKKKIINYKKKIAQSEKLKVSAYKELDRLTGKLTP